MSDPEPWQTDAPRSAMIIEKPHGTVSVSALGSEQFCVEAPRRDEQVEGYQEARVLAHDLAAELE